MAKGKYQKEIRSNKLLALRNGLGLSQKEVAATVGISTQSIDRWEKGKGMPSLPHLLTMSMLYQTLPEAIYFDLFQRAKVELKKFKTKKK